MSSEGQTGVLVSQPERLKGKKEMKREKDCKRVILLNEGPLVEPYKRRRERLKRRTGNNEKTRIEKMCVTEGKKDGSREKERKSSISFIFLTSHLFRGL